MAENTEFGVFLDTSKPLNDESFAKLFLSAWLGHPMEELRPERWGSGEPVRNVISELSLDELASKWCETPLMFSRVSKPRMKVSLDWRKNKGRDSRPYPWGLTAWIANNGGRDRVVAFFELVVTYFRPAFASATTYAESRRKHFVKVPFLINGLQAGTAEEFRGHHVQDTLPGVEWITYFGREVIHRIG